jgi:hypothetical protein
MARHECNRLREPGSCNGSHKSGGIGRSGRGGQILDS